MSTLASPSLTALSGETANFLAGGEIPIPIAQALGTTTIEYKQYGVSLAFTPTVLADGRISLHVRPEVERVKQQLKHWMPSSPPAPCPSMKRCACCPAS